MKTKILMVVVLMSLSGILMAQTTDVVPKKQGAPDQEVMIKAKKEALMNAMRGAQMNGRMRPHAQPLKDLAMGLKLTDAQKEAFKKSAMAVHKQLQPLRNELGEAAAHLKTLAMAEKPDFGAINKSLDKIGALRSEMEKIKLKNKLEMRAQLTEEQRFKLEMLKMKMKGQRMRQGQGPKGMMPGMI